MKTQTMKLLTVFLLGLVTVPGLAQSQRTHRDSIQFALGGDTMLTQKLSVFTEPAYLEMIDVIRGADFAFVNFEAQIPNGKGYPKAKPYRATGGVYMDAPPFVADELVWAGIDGVSLAHNHTADFGLGGLIETHRILKEAGLSVAGFGMNLADARFPAYLETAKGRVAVVAVASTFEEYIRAGEQGGATRGRPGISALRFEREWFIEQNALSSLKELATSQRLPYVETDNGAMFFGNQLSVGPGPRERTWPLQEDLEGIVQSIKEARRQADWVVVSIHAHEGPYGEDRNITSRPAEFLMTFARACIDAGADAFMAHGPHVFRGIEIYNGKPIFYSLANFIFQNETIRLLPAEQYPMLGLNDNEHSPADFFDTRSGEDTKGFPAVPAYWESVIALPEFERGALKEIVLYPIDLGNPVADNVSRSQRGRPMKANPALARKIIDNLADLSKPFGTEIEYDDGVGRIRVRPSN